MQTSEGRKHVKRCQENLISEVRPSDKVSHTYAVSDNFQHWIVLKLVQGWFEVMGYEMMTAGIVVACATVTGTRGVADLLNSGDASTLPIIVVGGGTFVIVGGPLNVFIVIYLNTMYVS